MKNVILNSTALADAVRSLTELLHGGCTIEAPKKFNPEKSMDIDPFVISAQPDGTRTLAPKMPLNFFTAVVTICCSSGEPRRTGTEGCRPGEQLLVIYDYIPSACCSLALRTRAP